ncbi:MAG: SDR family NAD(P)-dependent oxidoreductase, partial [Acidobacteriaceae bacterium]
REEAEQVVARATEHFGHIDVLVNNAGVITVGPVENQTAQDFREVMDSNFFTGVHCALAAVPQMLARRTGTIVNIASIGGKVAVPHLLPYTASKFAVVGFSEGLHAELRAKGVHVLTVCPELMRTGSHLSAHFSGDAEREYRWFSLAANLPGISTSAACAARRIVRAVQCRETEIAITPQAVIASRLAQLAPEIVVRAMSAVNRVLPGAAPAATGQQRGAEVRGRECLAARTIGDAAARRYNQTA